MSTKVAAGVAGPNVRSRSALKLLAIRLLNYLTNRVINHVPSYTLRHAWYRHMLGIRLGDGASILLSWRQWRIDGLPQRLRSAPQPCGELAVSCSADRRDRRFMDVSGIFLASGRIRNGAP